MFKIDLDTSGAERVLAQTLEDKLRLSTIMQDGVNAGVEYEKAHKKYQNRTGNLLDSTKGHVREEGGNVVATIEMGMPYAGYVVKLGYSAIEEAREVANKKIQASLRDLGTKLAG